MIISRGPNRRASSDSEPGPKRPTATATTTTSTVRDLLSKGSAPGIGSQDSARLSAPSATNPHATGVNSPISSEMPLNNANPPANNAAVWPSALRTATPSEIAMMPIAARNSSSPKPRPPLGNVENNRCRPRLLAILCSTHPISEYGLQGLKRIPHTCNI
jgi:hypothetical protein